ncbi:hypothetical protein CDL12_01801 [Handroanthus impetiginosus]|uniref:Uncharacterized protein n=1 Tax=Handroanthus impetiginosus TaxID=429701 RepID=A0A2G9I6R6_9LAMI|nr:hypothetical protein CDL12_01801 [Handroanthus impetiginosus]
MMKKVISSAGTISTVLGKDYLSSIPKKGFAKLKAFNEESWSKEVVEQFLFSMLGDDCELSFILVSDMFCKSLVILFLCFPPYFKEFLSGLPFLDVFLYNWIFLFVHFPPFVLVLGVVGPEGVNVDMT